MYASLQFVFESPSINYSMQHRSQGELVWNSYLKDHVPISSVKPKSSNLERPIFGGKDDSPAPLGHVSNQIAT